MNEADWLKARQPETMLLLVAPHLSARQWNLLACMSVRRLGKLLVEPRLIQAVNWAEKQGGAVTAGPEINEVRASLPAAMEAAITQAQEAQRAIVADADPDSDPQSFQHVQGRKTNPSAPYFQAAAAAARNSIESAEAAARAAGEAIQRLLEGIALPDELHELRRHVIRSAAEQASAGLHASAALKAKAQGDECADHDTGREVGRRYAAALTNVERQQEYSEYREGDLSQQKTSADFKALGHFLHELCGNVCRPAEAIDVAWLSRDVVGLARQIDQERDFGLMPMLNDALLDAGFNSRTILRHCRGLKEHADEPIQHAPGCWLIDSILDREAAFRAVLPLGTAGKPPRSRKRSP
jgi:hypothetical protein